MKNNRGCKVTADEKMMIRAMLNSGMTGIDISEKTGRSLATISKIRQEIEKTEGSNLWHNGGLISSYIAI